ncbi:hypothetical protein CQW23_11326 [Capsicum baccatum]|uniref:F-box domain-containing protein n=1 Tax=Capsicum baccatum TaxID=33114 RepID=A0A2G2WPF0_CAPBA|nr:hypothetical protein CQW23_11326 [Capsicum baccatum]
MMRRRRADRISELPEEILHHIRSFLEVKDGAVMGATWNRAWNSLSSLNFGNSYFLNRLDWTMRINFITHLLAIFVFNHFTWACPICLFGILKSKICLQPSSLVMSKLWISQRTQDLPVSKLKKVELGFNACPPEFDEVDIRAPNLVDLEMYQLTTDFNSPTAIKRLDSLSFMVGFGWIYDVLQFRVSDFEEQ